MRRILAALGLVAVAILAGSCGGGTLTACPPLFTYSEADNLGLADEIEAFAGPRATVRLIQADVADLASRMQAAGDPFADEIAAIAGRLAALPDGRMIVRVVSDYAVTRDQLQECRPGG